MSRPRDPGPLHPKVGRPGRRASQRAPSRPLPSRGDNGMALGARVAAPTIGGRRVRLFERAFSAMGARDAIGRVRSHGPIRPTIRSGCAPHRSVQPEVGEPQVALDLVGRRVVGRVATRARSKDGRCGPVAKGGFLATSSLARAVMRPERSHRLRHRPKCPHASDTRPCTELPAALRRRAWCMCCGRGSERRH